MSARTVVLGLGVVAVAAASIAQGHTAYETSTSAVSAREIAEVALPVFLSACLYACGYVRHRTRSRSSPAAWRAAAFLTGLTALAASLLSPLDYWSASSFALHMTQHELLMLVAAPLIVLGRPLPYFLWAFPKCARATVGKVVAARRVQSAWKGLLNPAVAWMLHAAVLWVWHAPAFFDAALRNRGVHDLQHLSFLASALIFWAALLEERARERQGAAVLYLFTTTVHTSVLGALLTFATHTWYSAYLSTTSDWAFSPLEDQQLGGLIMWVPASLVYVGVGLALLGRWIQASGSSPPPERRDRARDPTSPRARALNLD